MSKLINLTLIETLEGLKNKQFSQKELNDQYLDQIERHNLKLNIFLTQKINNSGIPVAIKDVIVTEGVKTTAGSNILSNFIPQYQSTAVERLLKNNACIVGKTNCDEFAMGSSGENSAYGSTKNPWDLTKVPGGSSSGSAASVAASMCVFALGTDTGGSVRQPASLCGVVGLKPSYGRVSRYGSIAMASSLDQIGPITKSVADARLVLEWISGTDGFDSNCTEPAYKPASIKRKDLEGLKVGLPKQYFGQGLNKQVEKVVRNAVAQLEKLGAQIVEVDLLHTDYAIAAYYILMSSEVSSNMGRFTGIRYGGSRDQFGPEVKRRIMLGTFALSTGYYDDYFDKAAKVRTLIKEDFDKAFEQCDVIVGPVSPTVAWNIGAKITDPLAMYLSDAYTVPASLAGIPGLSVPCGFADGLPVGLQILGQYMDEETILSVGEVYEQSTDWHKERPKL